MKSLKQTVFTTDADSFTDMEHRQHTRHLCNDGSVLRLSVRPEFRGRQALLVDVSAGGIGFLLEDALKPGTVLVFELQGSSGMDTIGRIARVRHCRPQATPADAPWLPPTPAVAQLFRGIFGHKPAAIERKAWLLGCQFDRPLEQHEVKQLLKQFKHASRGD